RSGRTGRSCCPWSIRPEFVANLQARRTSFIRSRGKDCQPVTASDSSGAGATHPCGSNGCNAHTGGARSGGAALIVPEGCRGTSVEVTKVCFDDQYLATTGPPQLNR